MTSEGESGEYVDYAGVEQATIVVQDIADWLYRRRALEGSALERVNTQIRALLDATEDPERYDPNAARRAFGKLKPLLR